jgi:hypothetical protein
VRKRMSAAAWLFLFVLSEEAGAVNKTKVERRRRKRWNKE